MIGACQTFTVIFEIEPDPACSDAAVTIPNVFTPNGDYQNDFFELDLSSIRSYTLQIYDRWGHPFAQATSFLLHGMEL